MASSSGDKGGYANEATKRDHEVALALCEDEESEESSFEDDEELTEFQQQVILLQEAGDVDGLNKLLLNKRKERKALSEDVKYIIESIKGINISGSGVFTLVIVFRGIEYKVEVDGTTTFRTLREAWLAQHKSALSALGINRSNLIVGCNLIFTCNGSNLKTHARQSFAKWGFSKDSKIKVTDIPAPKAKTTTKKDSKATSASSSKDDKKDKKDSDKKDKKDSDKKDKKDSDKKDSDKKDKKDSDKKDSDKKDNKATSESSSK